MKYKLMLLIGLVSLMIIVAGCEGNLSGNAKAMGRNTKMIPKVIEERRDTAVATPAAEKSVAPALAAVKFGEVCVESSQCPAQSACMEGNTPKLKDKKVCLGVEGYTCPGDNFCAKGYECGYANCVNKDASGHCSDAYGKCAKKVEVMAISCPGGTWCDGSPAKGTDGEVVCGTDLKQWKCTASGWGPDTDVNKTQIPCKCGVNTLVVAAPVAQAVAPKASSEFELSDCKTDGWKAETYTVTKDIVYTAKEDNSNCFTINKQNNWPLTLDCQGHKITSSAQNNFLTVGGINVNGNSIHIENCVVEGFGTSSGIYVTGKSNVLKGNTVTGSNWGIYVAEGGAALINNKAMKNGVGVYIDAGLKNGIAFKGNTACGNKQDVNCITLGSMEGGDVLNIYDSESTINCELGGHNPCPK